MSHCDATGRCPECGKHYRVDIADEAPGADLFQCKCGTYLVGLMNLDLRAATYNFRLFRASVRRTFELALRRSLGEPMTRADVENCILRENEPIS